MASGIKQLYGRGMAAEGEGHPRHEARPAGRGVGGGGEGLKTGRAGAGPVDDYAARDWLG